MDQIVLLFRFTSSHVDYMSTDSVDLQILQELRKIRESLVEEPAPSTPPPAPPKGFMNEFIQFLNKHGIVGLAIAFIMGGAVKDLVSALVADVFMPLITFFIPEGGWREAVWGLGPIVFKVGHFAGTMLDFVVIAIIVFLMMRQLEKTNLK